MPRGKSGFRVGDRVIATTTSCGDRPGEVVEVMTRRHGYGPVTAVNVRLDEPLDGLPSGPMWFWMNEVKREPAAQGTNVQEGNR